MNKIRKAVFPVAGLGTRFLPATKATPKEMLPIVDKPLIQYAVEEAVAAGVKEIIFVTGSTKRAIEDHFDKNFELETKLAEKGKKEFLDIVQNVIPKDVFCVYVRQPEALGLGHAVLCAKDIVGNEPFAVILPDDLIDNADYPVLKQMVDQFETKGNSIIAVQSVPVNEVDRYGIVDAEAMVSPIAPIQGIVEKPAPDKAPSTWGVVGRYILTPRIFELLEKTAPKAGGEIQLTDGIASLIGKEAVYAYQFYGRRYDCGSKLGYLEATVNYGLKHPEVGKAFRRFLEDL